MSDRPLLTSTRNPRVLALRALHDAAGRRAASMYLAEGPKLVAEALAAGLRPVEVWISPRLKQRDDLARLAPLGVPLQPAEDRVLDAVSDTATHQGVIAVMPLPSMSHADPERIRVPVTMNATAKIMLMRIARHTAKPSTCRSSVVGPTLGINLFVPRSKRSIILEYPF